jgi:hypothetical protein
MQISNELEHALPQVADEQGERRDVLGGVHVMVEKRLMAPETRCSPRENS